MTSPHCSSCGSTLDPHDAFCPRCGSESPVPGATVRVESGGGTPRPMDRERDEEALSARLAKALGDQYTVTRLLGHGGFAEVFEVWDSQLQRRLAVKVLRPDLTWTAGMLARFRDEARSIARLSHPNILHLHFVGEGEGLAYYAMPYIEGRSLAELLRVTGPLDAERTLALARPILAALDHAHRAGVVHRDIKPDNIMIDGATGRPLVVDFGIAKRLDGSPGRTQEGYVVGTPQYMSPEQVLGQDNVDARADLYAMGAVMYQMLTGLPPFAGQSSQEIVGKHLAEPAPDASAVQAGVPNWLAEVVRRCLAKRPADRFANAGAVLEALAAGAVAEGVTTVQPLGDRLGEAATELLAAEPDRLARRRRWRRLVVGLLVLVAVVAAGLWATAPVLELRNELLEPIRVTVNDALEVVLPPNEIYRVRLRRGERLVAYWYLIRPTAAVGTPMGEVVQGTVLRERPRGLVKATAEPWTEGAAYFAPLITNAGTSPLAVMVNAGLAGARSCGCTVPPGATRAHVGYYRLYANSTVEVRDPAGRSARFSDLGESTRRIGSIGLRFEDKDLR